VPRFASRRPFHSSIDHPSVVSARGAAAETRWHSIIFAAAHETATGLPSGPDQRAAIAAGISRTAMTLEDKKKLIAWFIRRCNTYADAELERYRALLQTQSGWPALSTQDKIGHWTAYRTFNERTLEELAGDTLDHWFDEPDPPR
jgi:hypothetical protein